MIRSITDNLYIGNANDGLYKGSSFDTVVALASPSENATDEFLIKDAEHDYTTFRSAVDTLRNSIQNDEEVLVHCNAGISRSVSVSIAAYVVEAEDVSYDTALEECRHGFKYPAPELLDSAKKYISDNKLKDN